MPIILCNPYADPNRYDPSFLGVTALLHYDGTNGSTMVIDSSALHLNPVNTGVILTDSVAKFGPTSGAFNGTTSVMALGDKPGRLGNVDFTIECWVYPQASTSRFPCIFGNYTSWYGGNGGLAIFVGHFSADRTKYQVALNGTFPAIQSAATIVLNQWIHVAVVRYNNVITLYLDGVANGSYTVPAGQSFDGVGNATSVGLAADTTADGYLHACMDEFRITKGLARYTANFTPPASAFPDA